MKKVLVIAYHFPPSDAVGALRPAKFAAYLPEFGWEPIVISADSQPAAGEAQFAAVPEVHVERVRSWPALRDVASWLGRLRSRPTPPESGPVESDAWRVAYEADTTRRSPWRDFAYSLMWLPDDRQGWIGPAVLRGLRLIRRDRPAAILVTSPPHSAQIAGLVLSRLTGLPLIADFRDPWIGNPATPDFIMAGPIPALHEALHDQVLERATTVVAATHDHAEKLARRPGLAPDKLTVIPNGFDASAFPRNGKRCDDARFTITYTGNFYHTRTPAPLFEALALLKERGVSAADVRVHLVGDCEVAGGQRVSDMAARAGFESSLELSGRQPHREALRALLDSDLLLLLASGQPEQIPAKAYEYLASGRPVLALTEPGATARLVETVPGATVLTSPDPHAIADVIQSRMGEPRNRPEKWTLPEWAVPHERRVTAEKLAQLLDRSAGIH